MFGCYGSEFKRFLLHSLTSLAEGANWSEGKCLVLIQPICQYVVRLPLGLSDRLY